MFDPDPKQISAEAVHHCEAGERLREETRETQDAEAREALWGHALVHVEYAAGRWWAHNEEYSSIIRFCPWCGVDLQVGKSP
jgi:hypothetical protein